VGTFFITNPLNLPAAASLTSSHQPRPVQARPSARKVPQSGHAVSLAESRLSCYDNEQFL